VTHEDNNSVPCIPWFFPTPVNISAYFCNPWETITFLDIMNNVHGKKCNCLPDCNGTLFDPVITSIPLRKCDSSNFGVSWLCNPNTSVQPSMYGDQITSLFKSNNIENTRVFNLFESIWRNYSKEDLFNYGTDYYSVYDRDIALLEVFFKKPTIIQITRQARMNWIDYISTVGGLLGLVLGMGIISFIELLWVCLRLVALKMNFQNLIP